jgi:hypothetical protein
MEKLNSDEKMEILMRLDGNEIIQVCQTSKDLSRVCNDERYNPLWRRKINDEFHIEYNGKRGYDKYRDLQNIFNTTYYVVYVWDHREDDKSFTKIFLTQEQAENFIIIDLQPFTYAQVKTSLKALGSVQTRDRTYSINKVEKIEPIPNLEKEKKNYEDEYEKFKGDIKEEDSTWFDLWFEYIINGFNSLLSNDAPADELEEGLDEYTLQFVERFHIQGREEEVKNFIKKNILIE